VVSSDEFPLLKELRLFPQYSQTCQIDLSNLEVSFFIDIFRKSVDPQGMLEFRTNVTTLKEVDTALLGDMHGFRPIRELNSLLFKLLYRPQDKGLVEIDAKIDCKCCVDAIAAVQLNPDVITHQVNKEGWDDRSAMNQEKETIGNCLIQVGQLAQRMIYLIARDHHWLYKKKNKKQESFEKILTDLNAFLGKIDKSEKNTLRRELKHFPKEEKRKFSALFKPLTRAHPHEMHQKLDLLCDYYAMRLKQITDTDKHMAYRNHALVKRAEAQKACRIIVVAGAAHFINCFERTVDPIVAGWLQDKSKGFLLVTPQSRAIQYVLLFHKILPIVASNNKYCNGSGMDFFNKSSIMAYRSAESILADVNDKVCKLRGCLSDRYPHGWFFQQIDPFKTDGQVDEIEQCLANLKL
jgi:hypothetical protein